MAPSRGARRGLTWAGLALLLLVNCIPPLLVVRQAFAPLGEPPGMPLRLLPGRLSLGHLAQLLETQNLLGRIGLSLWVAVATTALALALGFPAGWGAVHLRRLGDVMTRLSLASRILPPIAVAIPLTALLIPVGLYDHPFGLGLVVAHLTLGLPFAILLAYAAFREVPGELEESARVDGCTPLGAFWRIALPSVRGSLAGAMILVFLLSWDEFAYALLIQLTNRTLPPLIYYFTSYGDMGSASTLAVVMLVPAAGVIFVLQGLLTRGALTGGVKE
ncbi:MAG TPA: carbohydrate ABC transporter permease [Candidatus Sumerlaeota bacterium]|nr:carbohydrate ABC transporter permease [Candidatus Sumerlaeota bacterium]HOR29676.1 carbohydrate ABC transporter permease [Candidatus Sumerlaeota bacterium]HPK02023.1 carbohydrate ABC transporter permease [Candidatus Sumerlaeota bacterium]